MESKRILKQYNLVLIRYGEIWLKSQKVKMRMLKILINNIKNILKKYQVSYHKYQLSRDSSRIFFFFNNEEIFKVKNILNKVFGIYSFSPAFRTSNKLKNICERTIEVAKEVLNKGDSFALRVKRSGKHDYTSLDVAKIVGKSILDNLTDFDLTVNLSNPNKKIFIEIRDEFSYIFTEIIHSNWGGLPLENQKKVLVMDIGRLNDLIAGFLLMKRGCKIYPILFDISENFNNFESRKFNWNQFLHYLPYSYLDLRKISIFKVLKFVSQKINDKKYLCGICRLIRFEILSKLMKGSSSEFYRKLRALTDGVCLNSSTFCTDEVDLQSISLSNDFLNIPIFTPLIGLDSEEINHLKNKISKNFEEIDYCQFKPINQKFDDIMLKQIFNSLKIKDLIEETLSKIEEVRIF